MGKVGGWLAPSAAAMPGECGLLCVCGRAGRPLRLRAKPASNFPPPPMIKAVVKTIALLAILFVMLYVGMNNTHAVDFHFPLAGTTAKQPLHASAALIYFGMFAVGLLAGTILAVGGGGGGKGKTAKAK